jgi:hypothetical protein
MMPLAKLTERRDRRPCRSHTGHAFPRAGPEAAGLTCRATAFNLTLNLNLLPAPPPAPPARTESAGAPETPLRLVRPLARRDLQSGPGKSPAPPATLTVWPRRRQRPAAARGQASRDRRPENLKEDSAPRHLRAAAGEPQGFGAGPAAFPAKT